MELMTRWPSSNSAIPQERIRIQPKRADDSIETDMTSLKPGHIWLANAFQ